MSMNMVSFNLIIVGGGDAERYLRFGEVISEERRNIFGSESGECQNL